MYYFIIVEYADYCLTDGIMLFFLLILKIGGSDYVVVI